VHFLDRRTVDLEGLDVAFGDETFAFVDNVSAAEDRR